MKKAVISVFAVIGVILLVIGGFFGIRLIEKYTPTKEQANLQEVFGASGDQVALFLDYELQKAQGMYEDGQIYLPITWVNKYLNERFFWDSTENLLVYALPDSIVYADVNTVGGNGSPMIKMRGEGVFLSLGLVSGYTDIRSWVYTDGVAKRVFIDTTWDEETLGAMAKTDEIRQAGGIKSPIVTTAEKDSQVRILDTMETWSLVMTDTGYLGYVENKRIKDAATTVPVSDFETPVYQSTSLDEKIVLAFHQVTTQAANNNLESLIAASKGVNVVVPTWYALTDNEGNYTSLASRSYVDQAHAMGLQVWALVDNFSDQVNTAELMTSTTNRKKLIASLMQEAETYDLDGINLDFESLREEAGVPYVQFIRELSVACRERGLILSVDNYVPSQYTSFYNRKEQGIVADYVIIMGYDEHYAGGEMGSVASLNYVKNGILDTLEVVPKEKVINAVPFYTRVWTQGEESVTSSALGIARAREWIAENQVELYWQEELGQNYGELDTDEGRKYIWMEDEESLVLKMDLIKQYDLAGVGCWKLGLEDPQIWEVIGYEE